jgi:prevent-host-death family protein
LGLPGATVNLDKNIDQLYNMAMKKINASKFKEQSLAILDSLEPEGIVITKHGKPVAKLIPIQEQSANLIGSMKGKIKIKGDIFSTGVRWNAQS